MGNPNFAIPALKAIHRSNHDLIAVVSNPPKPMGRGRSLHSTSVGEFAKKNDVKLIEPLSLISKDLKVQLKKLKPDIFVVVAYKILPNELITSRLVLFLKKFFKELICVSPIPSILDNSLILFSSFNLIKFE